MNTFASELLYCDDVTNVTEGDLRDGLTLGHGTIPNEKTGSSLVHAVLVDALKRWRGIRIILTFVGLIQLGGLEMVTA